MYTKDGKPLVEIKSGEYINGARFYGAFRYHKRHDGVWVPTVPPYVPADRELSSILEERHRQAHGPYR